MLKNCISQLEHQITEKDTIINFLFKQLLNKNLQNDFEVTETNTVRNEYSRKS